jgi:hypothetical protein
MPTALLVLAALWLLSAGEAHAQAVQPCPGETVVLLPLQPVALSPALAREAEETVRAAIPPGRKRCLRSRAETVASLGSIQVERLGTCDEARCRRALAEDLRADWLLSGSVLGVGGRRTVNLVLWDRTGTRLGRTSVAVDAAGDLGLSRVLEALWAQAALLPLSRGPATGPEESFSPAPALWVAGTGIAAVLVGGLLGLASQQTERRVMEGRTGCPGTGEVYRSCFAATAAAGRNEAVAANVLFGAGVLLGTGATVMWITRWP